MGSSINTAVNTEIQTSTNQIFQSSQNICQANCTAVNENINIVITDSTVGNINITNSCTASALCTMRSNLSAISTQQLQAVQQTEATNNGNSWFTWPGYSINTTTNYLQQTLENSYTQSISNVCAASASGLNENINVYVSGSTVAGIDIGNTVNASASCAIDNTVSASVTQSEVSSQTATSTNGNVAVLIIAIIVIAIIVIAVVWLGTSSKKKQSAEEQQKQKQSTLKQLEAGLAAAGLTGTGSGSGTSVQNSSTQTALSSVLGTNSQPKATS